LAKDSSLASEVNEKSPPPPKTVTSLENTEKGSIYERREVGKEE